jgi:hypothetical protein
MNDVIIIDDVVSPTYQQIIENAVMGFSWDYLKDIANSEVHKQQYKTMGFSHILTNLTKQMSADADNENTSFLVPLLLEACHKANIHYDQLLRASAFMHIPNQPHNKYDGIHVNLDHEHIVALYYITDSDADTVLFDQTMYTHPIGAEINEDNFKEYCRVTPKKGRMLFFDGSRYHSSTSPSDHIRVAVSFDFIGRLPNPHG